MMAPTIINNILKLFSVKNITHTDILFASCLAIFMLMDGGLTFIGAGNINNIISYEQSYPLVFTVTHFGMLGGVLLVILLSIIGFITFLIFSNISHRHKLTSMLILVTLISFGITRICGGLSWFIDGYLQIILLSILYFFMGVCMATCIGNSYFILKYNLLHTDT